MKKKNLVKRFFNFLSCFTKKRREKRREMSSLFDWEMNQLRENGFSEEILLMLEGQKRKVVRKACHYCYPVYLDAIPFFPVFSLKILEKVFKSPLLSVNQKEGSDLNLFDSINIDKIYNKIGLDKDFYFIFGGENGLNEDSISGISPDKAEKIFDHLQLKPLNINEVLSFLLLFSNLYNGGGERISVLGSRYRKDCFVPEFFRSRGGFRLSDDLINNNDKRKIYPTCLERLSFS